MPTDATTTTLALPHYAINACMAALADPEHSYHLDVPDAPGPFPGDPAVQGMAHALADHAGTLTITITAYWAGTPARVFSQAVSEWTWTLNRSPVRATQIYGSHQGALHDFAFPGAYLRYGDRIALAVTRERQRRLAVAAANRARATFAGPTRVCRAPSHLPLADTLAAAGDLCQWLREQARRTGPRADVAREALTLPAFEVLSACEGVVR